MRGRSARPGRGDPASLLAPSARTPPCGASSVQPKYRDPRPLGRYEAQVFSQSGGGRDPRRRSSAGSARPTGDSSRSAWGTASRTIPPTCWPGRMAGGLDRGKRGGPCGAARAHFREPLARGALAIERTDGDRRERRPDAAAARCRPAFDLLSVDVDRNTWYVWEALSELPAARGRDRVQLDHAPVGRVGRGVRRGEALEPHVRFQCLAASYRTTHSSVEGDGRVVLDKHHARTVVRERLPDVPRVRSTSMLSRSKAGGTPRGALSGPRSPRSPSIPGWPARRGPADPGNAPAPRRGPGRSVDPGGASPGPAGRPYCSSRPVPHADLDEPPIGGADPPGRSPRGSRPPPLWETPGPRTG